MNIEKKLKRLLKAFSSDKVIENIYISFKDLYILTLAVYVKYSVKLYNNKFGYHRKCCNILKRLSEMREEN